MKKLLAKFKANKKGFTLVELIVVIAIIGVLALILVPNMIKFIGDSKQKSADASAKSIYNAASAAATKVLSDGGTLIAGPITSDSTVFDSDAAATEPTLSQYMTTIRGTFSITLNSHGVVSVTYTDTDGTTTSTYTG